MSKKDVQKYFDTVNAQYHEFVEELRDFEELCAQNIVAPEVVENAKKMFEPVKDNWMKLNYIMYLLNKPVRKNKPWYDKTTQKLRDNSITDVEVIEQNKKAKENFVELTKN